MQGDLSNPDAENKAYVSGNYTIMSTELAVQQAANASNDAMSTLKPMRYELASCLGADDASLKAFALVGMLVVALVSF